MSEGIHCNLDFLLHTVDGRKPAPIDTIYEDLENSRFSHLNGAGFLPSTVFASSKVQQTLFFRVLFVISLLQNKMPSYLGRNFTGTWWWWWWWSPWFPYFYTNSPILSRIPPQGQGEHFHVDLPPCLQAPRSRWRQMGPLVLIGISPLFWRGPDLQKIEVIFGF